MVDSQLSEFIELDHVASRAFINGDPEPKKALFSRGDDVTLANPLGPPALGWPAVSARLEQAAASLKSASTAKFERVSLVETPELAYTVELERYPDQIIAGSAEPHAIDLRVTTVFRREDGEWRIAHRHADPIVTARGIESAVNRS